MLRAIIFISVLSLYLYPSQAIAKNQPGDLLQIRTFLSQAMQEALLIEVDEKSTKDDSCGVFGPPSLPVLDKVEFLAKIGLTQSVVGGSKNHERFAPALKLTGRLHNEENRNRAYSIIVKAQARAGDIEGAYQTTALIKNPTWQVYPFVLIAAAHMAAGQQGEALKLLQKAFRQEERKYSFIAVGSLIAIARLGEADLAKKLSRNIEYPYNMGVLIEIGRAQLRKRDRKGALDSFMRARLTNLHVRMHYEIALDQAKQGKGKEAQRLLRGGRKALGQPGEDLYHEAFVEAQAENGFIREALEASGLIGSRQARTNAIRMIAESQLEQGDRKGAEATLLAGKTLTDGFKMKKLNISRSKWTGLYSGWESKDEFNRGLVR